MVRLTRVAIRRARARTADTVTADDLLVAALSQVSRFGIALIGPWAVDLAELDDAPNVSEEDLPDVAPSYGASAVAAFEAAARIARKDSATKVGLIHILVALGEQNEPLFTEMTGQYAIDSRAWRTALARGQLGAGATAGLDSESDEHAQPAGPTRSDASHLLSVDDASSLLGVHAQTVRNYIRGGKLPAYRLAGERSIRVLRRDLLALLEPVDAEEDESDEVELPIPLSLKEI